MPNHLINETSPYLLQHANNPVNWYAWGDTALAKAKKEGKPILVSIGYSTCHWCHVMERESFEDVHIAEYMNAHFVCIKVDREERPDIDAIYMEVVQAITGNGGWPLNAFLLPDGRPFFAGTYFPPEPANGRASWMQVLENLRKVFVENPSEVEAQAVKLTTYIQRSDNFFIRPIKVEQLDSPFSTEMMYTAFTNIQPSFDQEYGGLGGAPKFPSFMALRFLLHFQHFTNNAEALQHVLLSTDQMLMGGIYDQIGGGMARYAVDRRWFLPHFEKMLYDNALLVQFLAELYSSKHQERYADAMRQTLEWVLRDMTNPDGGFYSALDADSEGVEGKYYVWTKEEIESVLGGADSYWFCQLFGITEEGNWEHFQNILNQTSRLGEYARILRTNAENFQKILQKCFGKLLDARYKRVPPSLDDKILLDWNCLMITGFLRAGRVLNDEVYEEEGIKALKFVLAKFVQNPDSLALFHSYKNGAAKTDAMLDDYAFLIEALLEAYQTTFDMQWLELADQYTYWVLEEFLDTNDQLFFQTRANTQLISRKKNVYDNATPSGNAIMIGNLKRLSVLLDKSSYRAQSVKTLLAMHEAILKYPQSFGQWATSLLGEIYPYREIAIVGENYLALAQELGQLFIPNSVVAANAQASTGLPLLEGRGVGNETNIFLCSNYTCQLPVRTVAEVVKQLERK